VYNPAIAAMPAKPFYHYLSCRADLVCTVANFPGLYLMTEVQSVVAQMNPGQSRVSGDRVDALMSLSPSIFGKLLKFCLFKGRGAGDL